MQQAQVTERPVGADAHEMDVRYLAGESYESLGLGGAGFPRNLGGGAAAGGHGPALLATGVLPVRRPAP